jgi:cell division protein FtsB
VRRRNSQARRSSKNRITHAWCGFFLLWLVLLSGALERWVGGPGLVQWLQVRSLVAETRARGEEIEFELSRLDGLRRQLESNPAVQEIEIRRVLGYLRPNEMVFEY